MCHIYFDIFLKKISGALLCAVTHPDERIQRLRNTGAYLSFFNHIYSVKVLLLLPDFYFVVAVCNKEAWKTH